jgi:hypothetical protein
VPSRLTGPNGRKPRCCEFDSADKRRWGFWEVLSWQEGARQGHHGDVAATDDVSRGTELVDAPPPSNDDVVNAALEENWEVVRRALEGGFPVDWQYRGNTVKELPHTGQQMTAECLV